MKLQSKTIRVLLVFLFTLFIDGFSPQEIKANPIYGTYYRIDSSRPNQVVLIELFNLDTATDTKTIQLMDVNHDSGVETYKFTWTNKQNKRLSNYLIFRDKRTTEDIIVMTQLLNNGEFGKSFVWKKIEKESL